MIVLDTNVISELMRPRPDPSVLAWLDAQPETEFFLCSVVAAELLYGIARLPEGARRKQFAAQMQTVLMEDFVNRVLPFDLHAATVYADMVAKRERMGQRIASADAQIAAICLSHQATLATRNIRDFEGLGLHLLNPWALSA